MSRVADSAHAQLPVDAAAPSSIIRAGMTRLRNAGIQPARSEAEWLLSQLLGRAPLDLYFQEEPLTTEIATRFFGQIDARAMGVPLQYLLGEAEFFGRRFHVEPGVFIPRPETETVVEVALEALREQEQRLGRPLRIAELGTGSGCIAITVAQALPTCLVVAVELSWKALRVAEENIRRHGLTTRIQLVQGSWTTPLRGRFDGIISNPPYVPSAQMNRLPPDVRHEPRLSLDGGDDGTRDVQELMRQAPAALASGGLLVLECGEEQVEPLARMAVHAPWVRHVKSFHDLVGRPRGLLITRRSISEGQRAV